MALKKQLIPVLMAVKYTKLGPKYKGLDQSSDSFLAEQPTLAVADNVLVDKDDTFRKRRGFTSMTTTGLDPNTKIYSVDSFNDTLFIQTDTGNYTWSATLIKWNKVSSVGPRLSSYSSETESDVSGSCGHFDQVVNGSSIGMVWNEFLPKVPSTFTPIAKDTPQLFRTWFKVVNLITGDLEYGPVEIGPSDITTKCKVVSAGVNKYVVVCAAVDILGLGNNNIYGYTVDVTTDTIGIGVSLDPTTPVQMASEVAITADSTDIYILQCGNNLGVPPFSRLIKWNLGLTVNPWVSSLGLNFQGGFDLKTTTTNILIVGSSNQGLVGINYTTKHQSLLVNKTTGAGGAAVTLRNNTNGSVLYKFDDTKYAWFANITSTDIATGSTDSPGAWAGVTGGMINSAGSPTSMFGTTLGVKLIGSPINHPDYPLPLIPVVGAQYPVEYTTNATSPVDVFNSSIITPSKTTTSVYDLVDYNSVCRFALDEITAVTDLSPWYDESWTRNYLADNIDPIPTSIVNGKQIILGHSTVTNQLMHQKPRLSGFYYEPGLKLNKYKIRTYRLTIGAATSRLVELGGLGYRVNGSLLCLDGVSEFETSVPYGPPASMIGGLFINNKFRAVTNYEYYDAKGNIHRSIMSPIETFYDWGDTIDILVPPDFETTTYTNSALTIKLYLAPTSATQDWTLWETITPALDINKLLYTYSGVNKQVIKIPGPTTGPDLTTNDLVPIYTLGNILSAEPTPPFKSIATYQGRLFGIDADKPYKIWYSKLHEDGVAAEFNQLLVIKLPESNLKATAVFPVGNRMVIATEDELYWTAGQGPNNAGQGSVYSPPRRLSTDTGVIEDSSVVEGDFGIFFRGKAGFYIMSPALKLSYIGRDIEDSLGTNTIVSSVLMPVAKEIRVVLSNGDVLIFNYRLGVWTKYTAGSINIASATNYKDEFVFTDNLGTKLYKESSNWHDDGLPIPEASISTSWIKLHTIQGYQRIRRVLLTGHHYSGGLKVIIGFDYDDSGSNAEVHQWTEAEMDALTGPGKNFSVNVHVKNQKCEAAKIFFSTEDVFNADPKTYGKGSQVVSIVLEAAVKAGRFKNSKDNTK